ncbi:MAG: DUF6869 domain-containing protein [Hyphomicrobiaceae bacterium]
MTNDNTPAPAWQCLDCQLDGGAGSLCRKPDGTHNFEHLARVYLVDVESEEAVTYTDPLHRAHDCIADLVERAPAAAVGFLIVACAQCRSLAELSIIAAGPLENLLQSHGPAVISHLEKIAKIDPRFRLMLSGTWGKERIHPDVWARLVSAVSAGPVIDVDTRSPSAGMSAKVATKSEIAALFGPSRGEATKH